MANQGVDATLTVLGGVGPVDVQGFTVEVFSIGILRERRLGSGLTDAAGACQVRYAAASPLGYNLQVRLYDLVHRLIYESDVMPSETTPIVVHDIIASWAKAHSWTPNLKVGLTTGNQVEILVDNHAAWQQVTAAIDAATTSIRLGQLHLEVNYLRTVFTPDPPVPYVPTTGLLPDQRMEDAAGRGVDVRVLMNDFLLLPFPLDTYWRVFWRFRDTLVRVKGFVRLLNEGSMHAKTMVVDDQHFFAIASPMIQEYFDAPTHAYDEPRRGEMGWLFNAIRAPVHDVSVKVTGPAAIWGGVYYDLLWDKQLPNPLPAVPPPDGTPHAVQLVPTLPGNVFDGLTEGDTSILDAYQRATRHAEDFIYLENQYFTEEAIAEALIRILRARPALQVIMVLNPKVDMPRYAVWQDKVIERIMSSLSPAERQRIGYFSLWTHEIDGGTSRLMRNYIHSKVGIVDGSWATIGSANLDGVSLSTSQFVLYDPAGTDNLADRVKRAIELNAVFYNGVEGLPASTVPDELRRALWAEHLGYANPNDPSLVNRPADGWLGLWRRAAGMKLSSLNASPPFVDPIRVLEGPFAKPQATGKHTSVDEEALLRCGVSTAQHTVETEIRSFDFSTGRWK